MLLGSTTDKIQLVTSTTANIAVVASYADMDDTTKAVSVDRQLTAIVTATTTDVVAAPAAGSSRKVKWLSISNTHASASNQVTILYNANGTTYEIEKVTLLAGERMSFVEGRGMKVFDAAGLEKLPTSPRASASANTVDVVANAADTYLSGSSLPISGRLLATSFFKWRFRATKTAAGVASAAFAVRVGTAGTTADTARATLTSSAIQTAAVDTAMFELDAIFRVVGAAAVLIATIRMDHTAADGAGMGTFRYLTATSATFDSTVAGLIIGVSCNPGAAGVWTFQTISIEGQNLLP